MESNSVGGVPGYQVLAEALVTAGVGTAFGLMGEDTAPLVTMLAERYGVDYHAMRHEAAAVMAADGYAWASGRIGVAVLSRGPGFTNGITAAVTAVKSGRPVLIIAGEASGGHGVTPELKELDQPAISRAIGLVHVSADRPERLIESLNEALGTAGTGRPTVLSVPGHVLKASIAAAPVNEQPVAPPLVEREPSEADVSSALELLAEAKRPLIVCGRGGIAAKEHLEDVAERGGALLGTTLLARDLFRGHRLDLGIVGGFASDPVRPLLDDVDLVLAFGASLNSFTMGFGRLFSGLPVVQVDQDERMLGLYSHITLGIHADARLTAQKLAERLVATPVDKPFHEADVLSRIAEPRYSGPDLSSDGRVDPRALVMAFDQILPEDRVIVTDGGHFMGFPAMYVAGGGPDAFRQTGSFGSIGLGIGAAIGAAVARPERPTVLFVGDGGLVMSLGELETIARQRIPLTIVVVNDGALSAERHSLDRQGLTHAQAVYGDVDFAKVAEALGIRSATVRAPEDLRALESLATSVTPAPLLIDCKTRGDLLGRWLEEVLYARLA